MSELFKEVFEKWGSDAQLDVLQEECAELIVAISHMKRGRSENLHEFIEELADVSIMVNEFIWYLKNNRLADEFQEIHDAKMARLKFRVEREINATDRSETQ